MRTKNALLLGAGLIMTSGLLWSFTTGDDKGKMKRYQVIHHEDGEKKVFDTLIPMNSELSVEDYLKLKGIEAKELKVIQLDASMRGPGKHQMEWVSDEGDGEVIEIKVEIDDEGNKTIKKTVNGEAVELTPEELERIEKMEKHPRHPGAKHSPHPRRVRMIHHHSEEGANHEGEVKIKAEMDEEGNLKVRKWVNGEEVELSEEEMERIKNHPKGAHQVIIREEGGEGAQVFIHEMSEEGQEGETEVDIKVEIDEDGNKTMTKTVNGEEVELTPEELEEIEKHKGKGKNCIIIKELSGGEGDDENVFIIDGGEGVNVWTDEEDVDIQINIDEDGNKTIKKLVNGEEVELTPEEKKRIEMHEGKRGKHRVMVREMGDEKSRGHHRQMRMHHAIHGVHADGKEDFTLVIVEENVDPNAPRPPRMVAPPTPPKAPGDRAHAPRTDFKIFPNPNQGEFTVQVMNEEKMKTTIEITDIEGRIVFEKNLGKVKGSVNEAVNLNQFGAGTYLVNIIKGNERSTQKVVVQ